MYVCTYVCMCVRMYVCQENRKGNCVFKITLLMGIVALMIQNLPITSDTYNYVCMTWKRRYEVVSLRSHNIIHVHVYTDYGNRCFNDLATMQSHQIHIMYQ